MPDPRAVTLDETERMLLVDALDKANDHDRGYIRSGVESEDYTDYEREWLGWIDARQALIDRIEADA